MEFNIFEELVDKALKKVRDDLRKEYQKILVGKDLYKSSSDKVKSKLIGKITDIKIDRFTEFDDVIMTIWVEGRKPLNIHGCNLRNKDCLFGYFYQ